VDRQFAHVQIRNMLLLSAFALICFFITSFLLAKWMVKPVAQTWDKQRQFVADASHELKTPLTVILSNTEMLIRSGVVTDPRNRQRLDNINAESRRMRSLVESLLTLARSDNTPDQPPTEIINLSFQVTSTVLTLEPSVFDAGHRLVTEIAPNLSMYANAGEITQLIEILIDNACKYSDPGSEIRLTLSALSRKEAQLVVTSYGNPLSPEECTEIFERFTRTDVSREITHGYGLGLSIASGIVKHFRGTISAESDGQRANLFKVRLPLSVSPDSQSA
ncbi:MAG: HAMP domain-containing histidine kinase, partial [Clostridia bacterium]|nr:HAMP domain-containing histidine kinase [Clostridia bacterium]